MTAWRYDADDNVYYQIGIPYCAKPTDPSLQTISIFVPGAYFKGKANGDGTYACSINQAGKAGDFTPATAPIAFPVDTPGYMSQQALTEYASFREFADAGFVYAHVGCRGRNEGAPRGVVDLKAGIRFLRGEAESLPCDTAKIFVFGMSGGGAQSALLGSTGDAPEYAPYLAEIGAVEGVSDAVFGAMRWCPITSLETADSAYEWFMGGTRSGLDEAEQALSNRLAASYREYVNSAKFKSPSGKTLEIEATNDGSFAGSYCDYLKGVVEESLNHFLADTTFPYDGAQSVRRGAFPGAGRRGAAPPRFGGRPGGAPGGEPPFEARDRIARSNSNGGLDITGRYETVEDYVAALNAEGEWVRYNAETNTATIASLEAFVKTQKQASKGLGAFDQLDRAQGENVLFGYGDGNGAHFDPAVLAALESEPSLATQKKDVVAAFKADFDKLDEVGGTGYSIAYRLNAYSPLFYLRQDQAGYGKAKIAPHWRIRTGIRQSDTALSTEVNLALALRKFSPEIAVDFETIWGQFHTKAERAGDSTANFIVWAIEAAK